MNPIRKTLSALAIGAATLTGAAAPVSYTHLIGVASRPAGCSGA